MARGVFRCKACHSNTSLAAGTVFQDTRMPLRTWFLAMWFTISQENGVSALGWQRVLAWWRQLRQRLVALARGEGHLRLNAAP